MTDDEAGAAGIIEMSGWIDPAGNYIGEGETFNANV